MNININRNMLKKMANEEHSVMETILINHCLRLYEVIARENAKSKEQYQQARCAYLKLKAIFDTETMEDEIEIIDGVNWKEVAHRYKAESHENLKEVQRLIAENAQIKMEQMQKCNSNNL